VGCFRNAATPPMAAAKMTALTAAIKIRCRNLCRWASRNAWGKSNTWRRGGSTLAKASRI
jgi:hypothetical protein